MTEDQAWIRGLRNGEPEALRAVYVAYKDELFSLALLMARDRALAADALQDVFVALARNNRNLNIRDNLKRYLATCVVNRIRSYYRRSRPITPWTEADLPEESGPEADLLEQESAALIQDALDALPADQREVVVLHHHSGLTFKAIANFQDVSINTVQSRYRYGLAKLRTLLNHEMER
ncbi:RNA polymerase sigma factor [Planctomycetota bacterium]